MDQRIERLLARQEIQDALARYCRGMDRLDADLIRSVFHADATVDQGAYATTGDGMAQGLSRARPGKKIGQHQVGNQSLVLDGNSAYTETYFDTTSRQEHYGKQYDMLVRGRYLDQWERRQGSEFKIAERKVIWDCVRYDEVVAEWPGTDGFSPQFYWDADPLPASGFTWGKTSRDDLSYAFLAGHKSTSGEIPGQAGAGLGTP